MEMQSRIGSLEGIVSELQGKEASLQREKDDLQTEMEVVCRERCALEEENRKMKSAWMRQSVIPMSASLIELKKRVAPGLFDCVVNGYGRACARCLSETERENASLVWKNSQGHPCAHRVFGIVDDPVDNPLGLLEEVELSHSFIIVESLGAFEGTLEEYLSEHGALEDEDMLNVGLGVASFLAYLHDTGVVHGCLTSRSIFLKRSRHLKKGGGEDYLLEAVVSEVGMWDPSAINDDRIRWLCDEVIEKEGLNRQFWDDVWSFGVVMIEMMTGKIPFHSLSTIAPIARAIHSMKFDGIPDTYMQSMPRFAELVQSCLLHKPLDRPFMYNVLGIMMDIVNI